MLELIRMSSSMASPYKALQIWVKHFLGYLVYELFLRPKSWRGSLYIYLLSFPRFWTLSIEWFWFLFWSILNGVTLKTSNTFFWRSEWLFLRFTQFCGSIHCLNFDKFFDTAPLIYRDKLWPSVTFPLVFFIPLESSHYTWTWVGQLQPHIRVICNLCILGLQLAVLFTIRDVESVLTLHCDTILFY